MNKTQTTFSTDREGLINESEGVVGEITNRNMNIIINNDIKLKKTGSNSNNVSKF